MKRIAIISVISALVALVTVSVNAQRNKTFVPSSAPGTQIVIDHTLRYTLIVPGLYEIYGRNLPVCSDPNDCNVQYNYAFIKPDAVVPYDDAPGLWVIDSVTGKLIAFRMDDFLFNIKKKHATEQAVIVGPYLDDISIREMLADVEEYLRGELRKVEDKLTLARNDVFRVKDRKKGGEGKRSDIQIAKDNRLKAEMEYKAKEKETEKKLREAKERFELRRFQGSIFMQQVAIVDKVVSQVKFTDNIPNTTKAFEQRYGRAQPPRVQNSGVSYTVKRRY